MRRKRRMCRRGGRAAAEGLGRICRAGGAKGEASLFLKVLGHSIDDTFNVWGCLLGQRRNLIFCCDTY